MKTLLFLIISFFLLSGCKTRSQIAREKMITDMSKQVQAGQKISANYSDRFQSLEENMASVSGKVDEALYKLKSQSDADVKDLNERLSILEESNSKMSEQLKHLQLRSIEQSKFIREVSQTLSKLSGGKKLKSAKGTSAYEKAINSFLMGQYKTARSQLSNLLKGKKVKGARLARVLHAMGMVEYLTKNNQTALVYFSRLFTEHPDSGYNRNGLLHLAKTFKRLNQKDEARQTINELKKKFPKSKNIKEADRLLKTL